VAAHFKKARLLNFAEYCAGPKGRAITALGKAQGHKTRAGELPSPERALQMWRGLAALLII